MNKQKKINSKRIIGWIVFGSCTLFSLFQGVLQEDIGLAIFIFGLCFPLLLSSEEAKDNDEKIMKKISLSKLSFEIDEENLTEDEIYIVSELIKPRKDNMEKIKRLARFITLKQSERDGYRFNFEIEDNDDRIEIITNFMMESDDLNKIIALEYIDEENLNKFWNTSRCTELHKSIMKNYYKAYESQKRVDPKIILVIQNHIKNH